VQAETIGAGLAEGFSGEEFIKNQKIIIKQYHKYSVVLLNIVHGSIWGVLTRKGLMQLTQYDGSYLSGVIWANFTACLVMGLAIESDQLWIILLDNEVYTSKASIPVYTGLTTGFCGTVSSFSSVILEAFNKASNTEIGITHHPPNAAYGIMNFLAVILAEFGLSIMGFHMGKQLSMAIDKFTPKLTLGSYKALEKFSMAAAICLVIITCVLLGVKSQGSWRNWTFSMLFAPFGAILRFYLSKWLNSRVMNFPMGTFTANLLGTLLLAIFTLIARGKSHYKEEGNGGGGEQGRIMAHIMGCHVLTGLDDGFCGALTTVSTFVAELFGLKTIYGYVYGTSSIMVAFAIMVLVLGSYNWSVGLTDPFSQLALTKESVGLFSQLALAKEPVGLFIQLALAREPVG
ncbi:hypothetical protein KGF56_002394, partial [Candida oxycetoniae]